MADEIKEEKLDSPLVVHKKGDASYQEEGIDLKKKRKRKNGHMCLQ